MKNYNKALALLALAVSTTSVSASDFYGYARGSLSSSSSGGEQACYGNGASGHFVGRLGDECDSYFELGMKKQVAENIVVDTLLSHQTADGAQRNDFQSITQPDQPDSQGTIALRQINVQATGVVESIPEATLWAGKRYYDRKQVNLLDLFYLNNSGYGVGLENINMGDGHLAVALLSGDHDSRTGKVNANGRRLVEQNKLDVRYKDLALLGGKLDLAAIYGWVDLTENQTTAGEDKDSGLFFTAELNHELAGGQNTLVAQWANDALGAAAWENASGSALNASAWYQGDIKESLRLISYGSIAASAKWDVQYSALYQQATAVSAQAPNPDAKRTSLVFSPAYNWSNSSQTRIEIGYDLVRDTSDAVESDLQKVVVAQQFGGAANTTISLYAGTFFGEQAETRRTGDNKGDDGNIRFGAHISAAW